MRLLKMFARSVLIMILMRIILIVGFELKLFDGPEQLIFSPVSIWCAIALGFVGFYLNMKLFNEASKGRKDDVIFVDSAIFCLLFSLLKLLEMYIISRI